jgi:hypothetical protein
MSPAVAYERVYCISSVYSVRRPHAAVFWFFYRQGVRRKFKSLAGRLIDVAETGINELSFLAI